MIGTKCDRGYKPNTTEQIRLPIYHRLKNCTLEWLLDERNSQTPVTPALV